METNYIKIQNFNSVNEAMLNSCGIETQGIKIDGRTGKWSIVDILSGTSGDEFSKHLAIFALFESDTYGDTTDYPVCFFDWYSGNNNWVEIDGTFDDLYTALYDLDVIE